MKEIFLIGLIVSLWGAILAFLLSEITKILEQILKELKEQKGADHDQR